ncbi:MAG: hypothetical protein ACI93N_000520 [Flavobacteriaceae bacterium]|jgi:hypothetical protein
MEKVYYIQKAPSSVTTIHIIKLLKWIIRQQNYTFRKKLKTAKKSLA